MDGIAVASTAFPMRALQRAVKTRQKKERLPFRSSNDILGMEGVAYVLKRDAKIFGVGVAEKGV